MQNKANFRKSQVNVNLYNTMDYEEKSDWTLGENEPNQSQSKPISKSYPKGTGRKKGLWEAAEKAILLFYVAKRANPSLYSENTDT